MERNSPPELNQFLSNQNEIRINGKQISATREEIINYWKTEFINSMKEIEPNFIIDERNKKLIKALYSWEWARFGLSNSEILDPKKGLLLHGPLGVGKSVLLRGLQRYEGKINKVGFAFRNKSLGFALVSAAEISLRYAEGGIDGISKYTDRELMMNLAIDEVGREPLDSKHYGTGLNVIQTILQLRYEERYKFTTHLTTNLNPDSDFGFIYGDYVADRIKEMFNVIEIKGESRR